MLEKLDKAMEAKRILLQATSTGTSIATSTGTFTDPVPFLSS